MSRDTLARRIPGYLTVAELADESGRPQSVIRWHCRVGSLREHVAHTEKLWLIPEPAAHQFILTYGRKP
jgi:hypothetical protein